MNQKTLQKKLLAGNSVYILDEFEETAVRLTYEDGATKAYIKHKGRMEVSIPQSNETVCEIILSGNEISESEYGKY